MWKKIEDIRTAYIFESFSINKWHEKFSKGERQRNNFQACRQ